jgi:hypothetical protein
MDLQLIVVLVMVAGAVLAAGRFTLRKLRPSNGRCSAGDGCGCGSSEGADA